MTGVTECLQSPLLTSVAGIAHAFSTRVGGVSQGPFATANLSTRVGDVRQSVSENRARLLRLIDRPNSVLAMPKQVHREAIVEVTREASSIIEADALWTRDVRVAVAVLIADCVPILMASPDGRAVAAVHAGWRGTVLHIATVAVERLASAGFAAKDLKVAVGPAIGPCCFEIEAAVAQELLAAYPNAMDAVRATDNEHYIADLWQLNRRALLAAGVQESNIDVLRECTSCQSEKYFSHRRDHGTTGRQAAVIAPALKPAPSVPRKT